jgi:acyl carrier protein
MALKQELIQFIQENLLEESSGEAISENDHLIRRGIVDSMGLMKIMMFIEERTGTRVPDHEVTRENFQSVTAIDALVSRLRSR